MNSVSLHAPAATAMLWPFHVLDARGDPIGALGFCLFLFVTFVLMLLTLSGWVRFVERRPLTTIGLVGSHRTGRFLGGLAIGLATSAAVVDIGALLLRFALRSSVEEIVFRGWMFSGIARKLNVPLALLLSSATSFLFAVFACIWSLRSGDILGGR